MKNVTKSNALFALMIYIYFILVFSVDAVTEATGIKMSTEVSMIFPELVMMIPGIIYIFFIKSETIDDIGYNMLGIKSLILVVAMTFMLMPITSVLNILTSLGVESAGETITNEAVVMPYWKSMIAVALVPAVCEEFLFRGLIYHGFRRKNKFAAILLSAFMFGLMHLNVNQFSYAFLMGIIFALVVEITGSLISVMIMHFVFNGTSVTISYFYDKLLSKINEDAVTDTEGALAAVTEIPKSLEYLELIFIVVTYVGILVIAVCLMILAMKKLAKLCGKTEEVKCIFSKDGRTTFEKKEGKYFDFFFFAGVAPAIGLMILIEVVKRY